MHSCSIVLRYLDSQASIEYLLISFNHNIFSYMYRDKASILQILPALNSGGVERGSIDLATALKKQNFNSYIASAGGALMPQLYHSDTKHITYPFNTKNPLKIFANQYKIKEIIKNNKIDIVHARSRAPAWSAYLAAKAMGTKFVTTFHGTYNINNKLKRYYNSIMTKGDRVIAVSNFIADHIVNNYEINPEIIRVIHRGVDLDYFNSSNVNEQRILQMARKLDLPLDRFIILLPGRITRWKGHTFLLEALRNLPRGKFFCLIAGDYKNHISYKQELDRMIIDYDLQHDVAIVNNVIDMPALYMLCDIVVSASLEPEAFGRIAVEGQAMGKMVVATNIGGACETVIHNKTGWLIEPNDITTFSDVIHALSHLTVEERKHIGQMARSHVADNFSLQAMCDKTINLYKELLNS